MDDDGLLVIRVVNDDNGRARVAVAGELDLASAPQLRRCLDEIGPRPVLLDFSSLTYIDSTGINVIAQRLASHLDVSIIGAAGIVLRVLLVTGMERLIAD